MLKLDESIKALACALGEFISHPDYYKGSWSIAFSHEGKRYKRICTSYANAKAWSSWLRRKHNLSPALNDMSLEKVGSLPGFPKHI